MEGNVNPGDAEGLGARAEAGRVVIQIGRDLTTTYNAAAGAIELELKPAEAEALASALTEAARAALGGGEQG